MAMTEYEARLQYVMARRDVALVGGPFAQEETLTFGDESFMIRSDDGEMHIGLFANAIEATDAEGNTDLFLFRTLIPADYQKVEVGKSYPPKTIRKAKGKGKAAKSGKSKAPKPPVLESFPTAVHSTDLTLREMADRMVSDGTYETRPTLRHAVLFVGLSQGEVPDDEWTPETCVEMLADMRSGSLASATLNMRHEMSVDVVARVGDVCSLATESVIAIDAYCRRMSLLLGTRWEEATGQDGLSRSLLGSTLWALVPYLLREVPGTPREVAAAAMPALRLRGSLSKAACDDARKHARARTASVDYDGDRSLGLVVSLAALADPSDGVSVELERIHANDGRHLPLWRMADELGSHIVGEAEARHVLSVVRAGLAMGHDPAVQVCLTALLGNDSGRRLVTEVEAGHLPVASSLLLHSAQATDYEYDAWADWVAGEVAGIVGSVAYAKAVIAMIPEVCELLELDDAWDIINPNSLLDVGDARPDWAALADEARVRYASWRDKREENARLDDIYGEWSDWDNWEEWDDCETCLYSAVEPCSATYLADRFVDMCRLVRACRHAFRHLDAMGWRELLSAIPELGIVLADDGSPLPLHNDVVAAAYEAFHDLATEDGFDADGAPVGIRLPRVVMGDGSVAEFGVEVAPDGQGFVGRLSCDGDGEACYLVPADMGSFPSAGEVEAFVFEVCVALDEEGDGGAKKAKGEGDDAGDGEPDGTAGEATGE